MEFRDPLEIDIRRIPGGIEARITPVSGLDKGKIAIIGSQRRSKLAVDAAEPPSVPVCPNH
jgi:hypothetical protein